MARTMSQDLRKRVVAYVDAGHSRRAAARHFDVSVSFVVKLIRQWREMRHIKPKYRGRQPGTGKLAGYDGIVRSYIAAEPDITLHELAAYLTKEHGLSIDPSNIHRYLVSLGLTYKKNSGRNGTQPA